MKKIGKSFSIELVAAGLLGLQVVWSEDGSFSFDASVSEQQKTAVLNVYAAHNPNSDQRIKLLGTVDSERSRRWRSGFPVLINGVTHWFHSDEFSLTQHLGLKDKARDLIAAGGVMSDNITIGGQPVAWSTMDGSQVTITAQIAFDMVAAAAVQQALIFSASEAHRVAIANTQNPANYDVLTGWPPSFE